MADWSLHAALRHHRSGRLAEAETIYRALLDADPGNGDASHLLGVVCGQKGDFVEAERRIREAIARGGTAGHHSNLGNVLQRQGRLGEAIEAYAQAVRLQPDHADAHSNLGNALRADGRLEEAAAAYRDAIGFKPDFPEAHSNLGNTLYALGRLPEAVAAYRAALALQGDFADALSNLGTALRAQRHWGEAIAAFRRAVALQPGLAQPHSNLGVAFHDCGALTEAAQAYRRALLLDPAFAEARYNLGVVFQDEWRMDEAVDSYLAALEHRPDAPEAHYNIGVARYGQRRFDEAVTAFLRTLDLTPDDPNAHCGIAYVHLIRGDLRPGWERYEWRPTNPRHRAPFSSRYWTGEDVKGKTLLLLHEQGFGDDLQFARYAPLAAQRGARVVLKVRRPLVRLFRTLEGVEQVQAAGDPRPDFDLCCSLMSVPRALGTELDGIPGDTPYLHAQPELVEAWSRRIPDDGRLRVGLVWAGNPGDGLRRITSGSDRHRSMPLQRFAPLAGIPNVRFYSLQKEGPPAEQARTPPPGLEMVDLMGEVGDYADTAALIANLDLVIGVDTSVVHLAGALGKPVWVLSRFDGCWRWLLDRDDSPWYPTMRLFRQRSPGNWPEVIGRVAKALRDCL